jgi:hypothetical protein
MQLHIMTFSELLDYLKMTMVDRVCFQLWLRFTNVKLPPAGTQYHLCMYITFYKWLLNYFAFAQFQAFVPLLQICCWKYAYRAKLISGYDFTCNAGIKGVRVLVSLTLYFPRRSTVHESTTSLPTGVVRFPIARPNSGSSGTSLVVLHVSETESHVTSVTQARWWHSQGFTWSHEFSCKWVSSI